MCAGACALLMPCPHLLKLVMCHPFFDDFQAATKHSVLDCELLLSVHVAILQVPMLLVPSISISFALFVILTRHKCRQASVRRLLYV